jgi:hypothetical protein
MLPDPSQQFRVLEPRALLGLLFKHVQADVDDAAGGARNDLRLATGVLPGNWMREGRHVAGLLISYWPDSFRKWLLSGDESNRVVNWEGVWRESQRVLASERPAAGRGALAPRSPALSRRPTDRSDAT